MNGPNSRETPDAVFGRVRRRVLQGNYVRLNTLTADELAAAQALLLKGEAEIVSSACSPHLVAKLEGLFRSN